MKIIKKFLTPNPYSRPQTPLRKVTKVAVHYVGGAGAKGINVRNYFESLKNGARYASSHYVVGLEGEIIQCIPENEISYCTNQANGYSISIENCHPKADGIFTAATRESLKQLCADICTRYGLDPIRDIIRHYDVTGKHCPLCWVNDPKDFSAFKNEVKKYMETGETEDTEMVETINAKINGKDIEADAIVKDGRTYIQMRAFENAGFDVQFNAETKLRTINNTTKEIPVNIDGEDTKIKSVNLGGYNYVSVRDIAEALGKEVEFKDGTVYLK